MKEEKELFCWNSKRWINFMFYFPDSCSHQKEQEKGCNPDNCGYCKEERITKYYKNKLKRYQEKN